MINGSICQNASAACWTLFHALDGDPSIAEELEESAVLSCCFWCIHVHPELVPADLKEESCLLELAYLKRNISNAIESMSA